MKNDISKEAYKGTRDFYPEDLAVQKFIFNKMRKTTESFGYEEYNTPTIEPTELYQAKSGEEIVSEQTYTFTDRGERNVTLRPEMTPSVARLVAQRRRELTTPLRWYSIQNFFRYERPQKGRLREFWQLNADIFGVEGIEAEVEIISLGYEIMKSLGAKNEDFVIRINYAGLLKEIYGDDKELNLNEEEGRKVLRVMDLKNKITPEEFKEKLIEIVSQEKAELLIKKENEIIENAKNNSKFQRCIELGKKLNSRGINNIVLDTQLLRGFDYYTGIVFEFFDTNPENKRALFGGGRYDDLLDLFGEEKIPAVGFGMGDVTTQEFLQARGLTPEYSSPADLYLCVLNEEYYDFANALASDLRKKGLNVAIDFSGKKIGDQITKADKKKIPYVICIGEDEIKTNKFKLKNLASGKETEVTKEEIVKTLKQ
ncbi:MAG: histidine--tRNA ligase [Patescibacteria group bacterium]